MSSIPESVHKVYAYFTTSISVVANITLLIIIYSTRKSVEIGKYRYLLACFAIMDIMISWTHLAVQPVMFILEFGFVVIPIGLVDIPEKLAYFCLASYTHLYYESFFLLAAHFFYRYVLVCNPKLLQFAKVAPLLIYPALGIFSNFLFQLGFYLVFPEVFPNTEKLASIIDSLRDDTGVDLRVTPYPVYLCALFWNPTPEGLRFNHAILPFLCQCMGATSVAIQVIAFCAWRIVRGLENMAMSARSKELQKQLLRALFVQTMIPVIFSYLPTTFVFGTSAFGINLGAWSDLIFMATSIFPAVDPILIIVCVAAYRSLFTRTVMKLLGIQSNAKQIGHVSAFTTAIPSTTVTPGPSNSNISVI